MVLRKDSRDLEDRFLSGSQVSPVMIGHILPVHEGPPGPANPGSFSFYSFKGKTLKRLIQELLLLLIGKMEKSKVAQ